MSAYDHPLVRHQTAYRILPHTLVDVGELLGADRLSLDGTEVTFHRRGGLEQTVWQASLRDWLVSDGAGWHVVADLPVEVPVPA